LPASGHQGFWLTEKEAALVLKIIGKVMEKSTNATIERDVGSADEIRTAIELYVRLGSRSPEYESLARWVSSLWDEGKHRL
jgi:hypothetical protein